MPQPIAAAPSFEDILNDLEHHADDETYGPGRLASGFTAPPASEPAYVSSSLVSRIYETSAETFAVSAAAAPARPIEPPLVPAAPAALPRIFQPSTRPESIARELRIKPSHTVGDLIELRRAFARRNHPDRACGDTRDAATTRMSIANMLIDAAIRARAGGTTP